MLPAAAGAVTFRLNAKLAAEFKLLGVVQVTVPALFVQVHVPVTFVEEM
jgi:hypothetical protein